VDGWRASGVTAAEYSRRGGFSEGTLRYWAWRLGREARAFVRVVREGTSTTPTSVITIEVGDARVLVPAAFDRGALRDVLAVLREPRA
jgi:hypothetical protein